MQTGDARAECDGPDSEARVLSNMPPEPFPDSSNSHENDQKVRFVDTDLSIQPSHHGAPDKENESNERGADKYYKDMQSIHGDTVPPLQHLVSVIPFFRRLHFEKPLLKRHAQVQDLGGL